MNDRMKGMKLGSFSGIKKTQAEPTKPAEDKAEPDPTLQSLTELVDDAAEIEEDKDTPLNETRNEAEKTEVLPAKTPKSKAKVGKTTQAKEQSITVNIKIRKDQKEWLTDTASTVRNNNTDPVPPAERVYPQHLIGVAIDLLSSADVDWSEVRNVEELRKQLNL